MKPRWESLFGRPSQPPGPLSSPLPIGDLRLGRLYRIQDTEQIIRHTATGFSGELEVMGTYVGAGKTLSKVLVPYTIGVAEAHRNGMDHWNEKNTHTIITPGFDQGTGELGVQIHAVYTPPAERLFEEHVRFLPRKSLMLDKPFAAYFPRAMLGKLFGKQSAEGVSEDDIVRVINANGVDLSYSLQCSGDEISTTKIRFCPIGLVVGAFGMRRAYNVLYDFVAEAYRSNKFHQGAYYGDIHTHYVQTDESLPTETEKVLHQMMARAIPGYERFISPYDAAAIIGSKRSNAERGLETRNIVKAILLLDSQKNIVARSYFDINRLSKDAASFDEFERLTMLLHENKSKDLPRDVLAFFKVVERVSSTTPPGYFES